MSTTLINVGTAFRLVGEVVSCEIIKSGNINATYKHLQHSRNNRVSSNEACAPQNIVFFSIEQETPFKKRVIYRKQQYTSKPIQDLSEIFKAQN